MDQVEVDIPLADEMVTNDVPLADEMMTNDVPVIKVVKLTRELADEMMTNDVPIIKLADEMMTNDVPEIKEAEGNNVVPCQRNHPQPFREYVVSVLVVGVNPFIVGILVALLAKLIHNQLATTLGTEPFKGVCGGSNDTVKVSLNFNEAFGKAAADIVQMNMFMVVHAAVLICTLLRSEVLAAMLVSLSPFYYFFLLLAKAPNVSVVFVSFEVPIFWFVLSWAAVFSLLQTFLLSGLLFISYKLGVQPNPVSPVFSLLQSHLTT